MSVKFTEQRMPPSERGATNEAAVPVHAASQSGGTAAMEAGARGRVQKPETRLRGSTPRPATVRVASGPRAKREIIADPSSRPGARYGAGIRKLIEVSVASAIHALVWVVVVLWVGTIYYPDMTQAQAVMDAATVFATVWLSTFICFFVLVEEDDR